ncbi:hypothetical protein KUCAC02_004840 [Chaenocephalus aceratus]|uniref:Uncharacterized protein n=1 Tax=Chaenocephalus aceratus TaxID=36190 RepID=A0ACB9X0G9_CHAAC|nr:hypothetical protein KUCAC02_004840 [Chaenocephalus aceratus]
MSSIIIIVSHTHMISNCYSYTQFITPI